jgi:carbamoyl-phosphate synthase large subunit
MCSQSISFSGEASRNVLLTCAGRRNYLVRCFQEALDGRGQVFAADMNPAAPALREADRAFIVPAIDHPGYFGHLITLCKQYRVRLLISVNDLELPLLARQRARFIDVGTIPLVSSPDVVDICFDKWATFEFLRHCGLLAPKTYLSLAEAREALSKGEVAFPLVVKPRWGTASLGVEFAEDDEELELAYRLVRKKLPRTILASVSATDSERSVLIQERLDGPEYVLDIINDLEGRYVTTLVKLKQSHSMEPGGAYHVVTVENEQLKRLGRAIGQQLGHVGILDCDAFISEQRSYALEMNPRFGGGYPFSHIAGANVPAALIAWANAEKPDPSWLRFKSNVGMVKCERIVALTNEVPRKNDTGRAT